MRKLGIKLGDYLGKRLQHRLLAASVTTVVLSLALLGYLSVRVGKSVVRGEVDGRNLHLSRFIARDIDSQFDGVWENVHLVMYDLEEETRASEDALELQARAMLELRLSAPLTYRALYLFDDGKVLLHLEDSLEDLLKIRDAREIVDRESAPVDEDVLRAYSEAKEEGVFVSPIRFVGFEQMPTILLAVPGDRGSIETSQVAVVEMDLRDVWRRVDEVRIGQTGRALVVSRDGVIIAHPDRFYIGSTIADELLPVVYGYEGRAEYTDPVEGKTMLASYSPVGGLSGWGVVVEQERDEALAPVNMVGLLTLAILLGTLAIAVLVNVLVARSITRPIQHLAEATGNIARTGDLGQGVTVVGRDEVGQLAETFNRMISGLRQAREQRSLAEDALLESKERFRSMVENINEVIFNVDAEGRIVYISPVVEKFGGYGPGEITGQPIERFIHPDDWPGVRESFERTLAGQQEPYDFRVLDKDGKAVYVHTSGRPLLDNGRVVGITGVMTDISVQRELEEKLRESQKMEAIGTLVGGIAHEFNNLLTAILGNLSLAMLQTEPDTQIRHDLATVERASRRAAELVRQLLIFGRKARVGSTSLLDVNTIALEVAAMLKQTVDRRINVRVQLAEDLPIIAACRGQVDQVLTNLCTNASDALSDRLEMVPGSEYEMGNAPTIIIETECVVVNETGSPRRFVRIGVSDNGCGMDAGTRARVFEPFFTTKEVGKGTGLGMAMVHSIVEGYGGRVEIYSEPGVGTDVDVYLPVFEGQYSG